MEKGLFVGDSIKTFSGLYMNVFEPTEDMICIEDIAHGLSNICRFAGHTPQFYSVAQHSVLCARQAPKDYKLQALMHDASEAYLLDMPRPIKRRLPEYKRIEDNLMRVIAQKFNIPYPLDSVIKKVDMDMLQHEYDSMMKDDRNGKVYYWTPKLAEDMFLSMFKKLKRQ